MWSRVKVDNANTLTVVVAVVVVLLVTFVPSSSKLRSYTRANGGRQFPARAYIESHTEVHVKVELSVWYGDIVYGAVSPWHAVGSDKEAKTGQIQVYNSSYART